MKLCRLKLMAATTLLCLCNFYPTAIAQEVELKLQKNADRIIFSQDPQVQMGSASEGEYGFAELAFENYSQELSEFWIGVQCEEAGEFEAEVSELGKVRVNGGLKVIAVIDESPAKSAKLQENDILFRMDGEILTSLLQLTEHISTKETESISFTIVREGKLKRLEITPAKRPTEKDEENYGIHEALAKAAVNGAWRNHYLVDFWGRNNSNLELPKGYVASVVFLPNENPVIEISKGKENWLVEAGKLSGLPEETHEFAGALLSRLSVNSPASRLLNVNVPSPQTRYLYDYIISQNIEDTHKYLPEYSRPHSDGQSKPKTGVFTIKLDRSVEEKINDLQEQIQDLAKAVEELKDNETP